MDEFDYQDYILLYDRMRSDGVIFHRGVFDKDIGKIVPIFNGNLAFDATQCLGVASIEQDDIGLIAKCKFSDTYMGSSAKSALLETEDMTISCPVYCVKRDGENVTFGDIRAVAVICKNAAFTYSGDKKGE